MQVSAVSSGDSGLIQLKFDSLKSSANINVAENVLNFISSVPAKSTSDSDLFVAITVWKDFCHKQILDGKIDYIA